MSYIGAVFVGTVRYALPRNGEARLILFLPACFFDDIGAAYGIPDSTAVNNSVKLGNAARLIVGSCDIHQKQQKHTPLPLLPSNQRMGEESLSDKENVTRVNRVTSDLPGRMYQHREGLVRGFTKWYGIKRLVWFEVHDTMEQAIVREKRIKRWPRAWKYDLIHSINPAWRDLAEDFGFPPLPLK